MSRLLLIAATVLSGLLPMLAAAQPEAPPAAVRVAQARIEQMAPMTWVAGTVISRSDARLAAEVEGRLLEVADVGTVVETGDVIAVIEDTTLRLRATELEAEVMRAEARLTYLTGEAARQEQLAQSNLAAQSALAETVADRNVARSELAVARSRLSQMQDQLERTRLRAPFAGTVVERLVNAGERVGMGTQVVRLIDDEHLEVVARAPLDYLPYVQNGQVLTVRSGRRDDSGVVRTVVALGNESQHVFEVRVDVPHTGFAAGQTVRMAIPVAGSREVLAVPRDALVLRSDGITVFVVEDDMTARQVIVTTGIGNSNDIAIEGDVPPGSQVIIRGNERLRPGQSVQIIES